MSTSKLDSLRGGWRWAAFAGLSTALLAPLPLAAQADDDLEELEAFTATGSRIKRLDVVPINPVLSLDRQQLDETGFTTVGDAIRSLPFASGQALTPDDSGTSFTPGVSSFNLRGLGNNNLLVLVNGRRAAPYGASGFNGFQSLFDFNSLPTAAIERIEVLKDGGSAIYGSDAVSGVVNIILRRDFEGLTTSFMVGNTDRTDSTYIGGSAIAGTSTARTSIIVAADWDKRNSIAARDLSWSTNADKRPRGGRDFRSSAGFPGLVFVPGVGYRSFLAPTTNPRAEDAVPFGAPTPDGGNAGQYNFLAASDMFPETENIGFYSRIRHELTDTLYFHAEASYRQARSIIGSAPTPMFNFNEQGYYREMLSAEEIEAAFGTGVTPDPTNRAHYREGVIEAPEISIPAYNPFNPWGVLLFDDVRVRFVELGNRVNDVMATTPRLLFGIGGVVNDVWEWETGIMRTESRVTNRNRGNAQDRLVQDAFDGITFDAGTPDEVTLYLNPFGPNDQRILDYISINNPVTGIYKVESFDIGAVNSEIFEVPSGVIGFAAGFEYRDENLDDIRTALNETGQIVGGSEGSSVQGRRDVIAVYAEATIPVLPQVEIQLAGRHERYSDFGTTTKPKVSIKVRPVDWLMLRGSYGESFLAPNLPFLYTAQSTSFTPNFILDEKRPDLPAQQIKMLGGGNPDLQPETTETWYAGVTIEPPFLEGLVFEVDYVQFDSTNLIDRFEAQFLLDNEDDPAFGQFVIRRAPEPGQTIGQIEFVRTTWENTAERKARFLDLAAQYTLTTDNLGRFRFRALATYLDHISFGGRNFAGTRLYPQWRGNFSTSWTRGDWGASVFVNYTESRKDPLGTVQQRWGSFTTVNPQVSFSGLLDTTITLGARNVFDRIPPFDDVNTTGYTDGIHSPEPRFWYLRVSKDW
ncbi:MAG: TonB-dependent receptor [Puniceicoccaceae bacterium]|nr:MAG: TonB-dependent receptor [Puniceicoccaceae bacterium]